MARKTHEKGKVCFAENLDALGEKWNGVKVNGFIKKLCFIEQTKWVRITTSTHLHYFLFFIYKNTRFFKFQTNKESNVKEKVNKIRLYKRKNTVLSSKLLDYKIYFLLIFVFVFNQACFVYIFFYRFVTNDLLAEQDKKARSAKLIFLLNLAKCIR